MSVRFVPPVRMKRAAGVSGGRAGNIAPIGGNPDETRLPGPPGLKRDFSAIPARTADPSSAPFDRLFPEAGARGVPHRAAMESAFGEDFSAVRVVTGRRALLDPLGADAATAGERIAFGPERPSKRLVGHELAHVVQRRRGRLADGSTGAGRDAPAEHEADLLASTVALGGRAVVSASPAGSIAFSPKNPFDEPKAYSSAAEATAAMNRYKALAPAERRSAVAASYKKDLVRVLAALSTADQVQTFVDPLREISRWVEEEETRAATGMTDDQIAGEQAKFMTQKAVADAQAAADAAAKLKGVKSAPATAAQIEKARKDAVSATSSVQAPTSWWDSLTFPLQAFWIGRGKAAIDAVVKHATAKHPELGITAANFKLDYPGVEKIGGNVIAAGSPAIVGKAFVTSAELNPAYVLDIVVHEVFGHPEYGTFGTEYHYALYDKAAPKVPSYVKPAEGTPERKAELFSYAYPETEIFAVLRSAPYRTPPTKADAPAAGTANFDTQQLTTWHVGQLKTEWSPKLIVGILRGLRQRLVIDPRITAAALAIFDTAVQANFDAKTRALVAS